MTSLVLWIFLLSIYLVFRQELGKYFNVFQQYSFLTIILLTCLMSYVSIRYHDYIYGFLIVILYHMNKLKTMLQDARPVQVNSFLTSYIFHVLVIMGLLFVIQFYEDRHQSLVHREQVLLYRNITYTLLFCFVLIAAMDMI
jgi:hypothetical protein